MIAIGLGLAWMAVITLVVGERRAPTRLPSPPPWTPITGGVPSPPGQAAARAGGPTPVTALGAWLRRHVGRPPDPDADRRVGRATLAAAALAPWAPPLAILPMAWAVLAPTLLARRARRLHEAAIIDQLPDVVDLLVMTTAAALPISAALCAIGRRPGGPLGAALERAAAHIDRGGAIGSALGLIVADTDASTRPLVDALAAHDRYGTPLAPALERVAIESRLRRRRRAEEAARRLPVTLLIPLVLTTLPAFALLTVVPLLAGSFASLTL